MFAIPVSIGSEADLYEPFDPAGKTLSTGLRDYLESFVEDREMGQEVRLELVSAAPVDLDRFDSAYRMHVDVLIRRCRARRAKRTANALRLLGIGIAFVVAGVALARRASLRPASFCSTNNDRTCGQHSTPRALTNHANHAL